MCVCMHVYKHYSGSRTSETGAKFLPKFFNDVFRRFSKNFCISPKNLIYLPKFLMMTFFSHRPFSCFMWYFFPVGGQIRSRHRYGGGGQNPYFSTKSQCYHCSFCPEGDQTPLPTSMGGSMAGFCPLYTNTNQI